jgi:hypothetical protein
MHAQHNFSGFSKNRAARMIPTDGEEGLVGLAREKIEGEPKV